MSRIYHTDLMHSFHDLVMCLFGDLSRVRVARILCVFLRYRPTKNDEKYSGIMVGRDTYIGHQDLAFSRRGRM